MKEINWLEITEALQKRATSDLACRHLSQMKPLSSAEQAQESFEKISEFRTLISENLRPDLSSLDFFELWFSRLAKNATLKVLEIKDIRRFCLDVFELQKTLKTFQLPYLEKLAKEIINTEPCLSTIDDFITDEGGIRKDASHELFNCIQEKEKLEGQIKRRLDNIVKEHNMKHLLQDQYVTTREGRWVLPIKSSRQNDFKGIIHDASQSRQTVFMEPQEIIAINNDLRKLESRITDEIERLLKEISAYFYSFKDEFSKTKEIMLACDQEFAKARLSWDLKAEPCQFHEGEIYLSEARNPILVLEEEKVISNTIHMDQDKRILILSGPNAGGKTVLLKTIGLSAYMAACGLHICAHSSSKLPFFKEIYVALGDLQNISAHLSTFAAHLEVLNLATKAQGSDKLILIDEICGATDPEEGGALARSFIEVYLKNQVFAIITSHLSYLKSDWESFEGVINGSLEYDEKSSRPLYKFVMGLAGQSLALQIAKNAGIHSSILERAFFFLTPEKKKQVQKKEEEKQAQQEVKKLKQKLQEETKEYEKKRHEYEARLTKIESSKNEAIEKERQKARDEMEVLLSQAKAQQVFDNYKHLQKMKEKIPKVISYQETSGEITTQEEFEKQLPPGTSVVIKSLGRMGVVQSVPNKKGEVEILSQSVRLSLGWQDLQASSASPFLGSPSSFQPKNFTQSGVNLKTEVDLRGLSVEQALEALEKQIDEALLNEVDRLKVIHGIGSESLKRAVRSYLSKSLHVKKWMGSQKNSEGDGVTWIEF